VRTLNILELFLDYVMKKNIIELFRVKVKNNCHKMTRKLKTEGRNAIKRNKKFFACLVVLADDSV